MNASKKIGICSLFVGLIIIFFQFSQNSRLKKELKTLPSKYAITPKSDPHTPKLKNSTKLMNSMNFNQLTIGSIQTTNQKRVPMDSIRTPNPRPPNRDPNGPRSILNTRRHSTISQPTHLRLISTMTQSIF